MKNETKKWLIRKRRGGKQYVWKKFITVQVRWHEVNQMNMCVDQQLGSIVWVSPSPVLLVFHYLKSVRAFPKAL